MNDAPFNNLSNKDRLLADWKAADEASKLAVEKERDLRKQVIDAFSTETNELKSGVENIDAGWGFDLKIEHKIVYKLDNANDFEKVEDAIDQMEAFGELGEHIANSLFKRKYDVSVTEYKKLDPKYKVIIDKILTIEPASKSVKLVKRAK